MMYIFLSFVRNMLNRSSYFSPMQAKGFFSEETSDGVQSLCEQVEMCGDEESSICATGMSQMNPLQKSTIEKMYRVEKNCQ